MTSYVFTLEPDDNGTYLATCDAFPEVATFVEEPEELFLRGLGAIEEAVAARIADGRDIPSPSTAQDLANLGPQADGTVRAWVKLPLQTDLKVQLYRVLREEGVTRAELQRRLAWKRESVDRLFRLDHQTRNTQFDAAFRVLHRAVNVQLESLD